MKLFVRLGLAHTPAPDRLRSDPPGAHAMSAHIKGLSQLSQLSQQILNTRELHQIIGRGK